MSTPSVSAPPSHLPLRGRLTPSVSPAGCHLPLEGRLWVRRQKAPVLAPSPRGLSAKLTGGVKGAGAGVLPEGAGAQRLRERQRYPTTKREEPYFLVLHARTPATSFSELPSLTDAIRRLTRLGSPLITSRYCILNMPFSRISRRMFSFVSCSMHIG